MRQVVPSPRRTALAADLVLVFVTAIWGSTFVVNRLVLDASVPPLLFLVLRFGLAAAILLAIAKGRPRTPGLLSDSAAVGTLLALGIGCQLVGQLTTTASKAAFITGLSVPLTPIVGFLVTRKKPSAENLAGLVVATAGFAVLAWPKEASALSVGDFLILLTAVSYAWIIVRVAEASGRHDVRWFAAGQIGFAALGVAAARLAAEPFLAAGHGFLAAEANPLVLDGRLAAAVLWMALAATVVTFLVQTWAQARMSATHAAIVFALEPVFTALFAAAFLGERLAGRDLAGAALVLLGIVVSELPLSRR
jgi:drug/metabolite transporter (DMT)-like permease